MHIRRRRRITLTPYTEHFSTTVVNNTPLPCCMEPYDQESIYPVAAKSTKDHDETYVRRVLALAYYHNQLKQI